MMTRQEFEQTLSSPDCISFWLGKSKAELKQLLGSDVANMAGFEQRNPHHCYDLLTHTLHTVDGVREAEDPLLSAAAFFHDIGKVSCAREKQGRLVFYGHSDRSAKIARPLLTKLGYRAEEIEQICFLIAHHDDFISYVLPREDYDRSNPHLSPITAQNVLRRVRNVELHLTGGCIWYRRALWERLVLLCRADAAAQAEVVIQNGAEVDSKAHKLAKIDLLEKHIRKLVP